VCNGRSNFCIAQAISHARRSLLRLGQHAVRAAIRAQVRSFRDAAWFRNRLPLSRARRSRDLWKRPWVLGSYVWTACGRARGRKRVCRSLRRSSQAADGCGASMGVRSIQALRESPPFPRLEALSSRFTAPQSVAGESTSGRLCLVGGRSPCGQLRSPQRFIWSCASTVRPAAQWATVAASGRGRAAARPDPRAAYGQLLLATLCGRCARALDPAVGSRRTLQPTERSG
jgi:hypothetical protein